MSYLHKIVSFIFTSWFYSKTLYSCGSEEHFLVSVQHSSTVNDRLSALGRYLKIKVFGWGLLRTERLQGNFLS